MATGAKPLIPPIEGIDRENVYLVEDVLSGTVKLNKKRIAVIGSGMTGLETAEYLAEQGNVVSVIEMAGTIGPDCYLPNLIDITKRLRQKNIELMPGHQLQRVAADSIELKLMGQNTVVNCPVDAVVLSLGVRPENEWVREIKEKFSNVKVIGDAGGIGRIGEAIRSGFVEAYNLAR